MYFLLASEPSKVDQICISRALRNRNKAETKKQNIITNIFKISLAFFNVKRLLTTLPDCFYGRSRSSAKHSYYQLHEFAEASVSLSGRAQSFI